MKATNLKGNIVTGYKKAKSNELPDFVEITLSNGKILKVFEYNEESVELRYSDDDNVTYRVNTLTSMVLTIT